MKPNIARSLLSLAVCALTLNGCRAWDDFDPRLRDATAALDARADVAPSSDAADVNGSRADRVATDAVDDSAAIDVTIDAPADGAEFVDSANADDASLDSALDALADSAPDARADSAPDALADSAADARADSAPDVVADGARDAATDSATPRPCVCAESGASCTCTGSVTTLPACTIDAIMCGAITPCPTNYTCSAGRCVCNNPSVCGPACVSGACPCGLVCNGSNRCVLPPPCAFSDACPTGQFCSNGQCVALPPAGPNANGSMCGSRSECSGRSCVARTCTTPCTRNDQCPMGLVCAESDNLEGAGCILATSAWCSGGCTGAAEVCSLYRTPTNTNCSEWCATNADCPGGACTATIDATAHPAAGFLFYRACIAGPRACAANEIDYTAAPGVLRCASTSGCRVNADCPAMYPLCSVSPRVMPGRGICTRVR